MAYVPARLCSQATRSGQIVVVRGVVNRGSASAPAAKPRPEASPELWIYVFKLGVLFALSVILTFGLWLVQSPAFASAPPSATYGHAKATQPHHRLVIIRF